MMKKAIIATVIIFFAATYIAAVRGQASTTPPRIITVDGGWSPWSTVATPCVRPNAAGVPVNVSCGGGVMMERRSCTNPKPQVKHILKYRGHYFLAHIQYLGNEHIKLYAINVMMLFSVTRFGEISPFWPKLKNLRRTFDRFN